VKKGDGKAPRPGEEMKGPSLKRERWKECRRMKCTVPRCETGGGREIVGEKESPAGKGNKHQKTEKGKGRPGGNKVGKEGEKSNREPKRGGKGTQWGKTS